jgi:hypothetical protein
MQITDFSFLHFFRIEISMKQTSGYTSFPERHKLPRDHHAKSVMLYHNYTINGMVLLRGKANKKPINFDRP